MTITYRSVKGSDLTPSEVDANFAEASALQTITLTGDVTGSGTGTFVATISSNAVTYAKMQDVTATDRLLGRSTAGAGDVEEIACTAAGRALLDDASASDQRATLGLGTLATQNGTFSGTSSGTNTGDQTSIVGISGTLAEFNTACTDANFATTGANTFTGDQTITGALSAVVSTATPYSSANMLSGTVAAYLRNSSTTDATAGVVRLEALGSASAAACAIAAVHTGDGASALVLGTRASAASNVTERLRIDSAGNIGTGGATVPTVGSTQVFGVGNANGGSIACLQANAITFRITGTTSGVDFYGPNSVPMIFYTNGTEKMRIASSGDLTVSNSGNGLITLTSSAGAYSSTLDLQSSAAGTSVINASQILRFSTAGTEGARLDLSRNLLVGATAPTGGRTHTMRTAAAGVYALAAESTHASNPLGQSILYTASSPNDTTHVFLDCSDSTQQRAAIRSNGGLANFSANDVNLSDARLKTDIAQATTYWDKVKAIEVVTFLYRDQTDTELNLGVIAQQLDSVAPELVDHSGPYLAVYQTDLQYATLKALQEAMARIEQLEARLDLNGLG